MMKTTILYNIFTICKARSIWVNEENHKQRVSRGGITLSIK